MATTERLEGLSTQVNARLGRLDAGLREGLREIRDELRTMNGHPIAHRQKRAVQG
jgi:hypothetical protein